MRLFTSILLVLIFASLAWYFFKESPRDYDVLHSLVESRFERTNFVWLTHYDLFLNEYVKSVLIFGYEDNHAVCLEVAEDSERRYVSSQYRCEFVGD